VSDHLDAPGLKPPHGEARIDIIDEQLAILTKGKAPSQGVKPHSDTLTDMPCAERISTTPRNTRWCSAARSSNGSSAAGSNAANSGTNGRNAPATGPNAKPRRPSPTPRTASITGPSGNGSRICRHRPTSPRPPTNPEPAGNSSTSRVLPTPLSLHHHYRGRRRHHRPQTRQLIITSNEHRRNTLLTSTEPLRIPRTRPVRPPYMTIAAHRTLPNRPTLTRASRRPALA
jgi:hypothetical protein